MTDPNLMTPGTYRTLLLASVAFGIIAVVFDVVVPSALPDAFSQAQKAYDENRITTYPLLVLYGGLFIVIAYIASVVGLYLFRSWAPRLAIIGTAFALLITIDAPMAVSGWAATFGELCSMLWGVVVILPYFSPLRERFAESKGIWKPTTPQRPNWRRL